MAEHAPSPTSCTRQPRPITSCTGSSTGTIPTGPRGTRTGSSTSRSSHSCSAQLPSAATSCPSSSRSTAITRPNPARTLGGLVRRAAARAPRGALATVRADERLQPRGAARLAARRGSRPLGPHHQSAVRAGAPDDRLRPHVGARRGRVPLRLGRDALPRPARRLRDVRRRPEQPASPRGARRGARARDAGHARDGDDAPPRPARRAADRPRRRPDRTLPVHELRHRVGRGGDQARPRRDRTRARALRRARLPRPDARLALGERQRGVHGSLPAAAARVRPGPVRRSRGARGRAAARGRRALPRRARAGQGHPPPAGRLPRGSAGAVPPLWDALLRRRGDDRVRPDRPRCSRSSTGGSSRIS